MTTRASFAPIEDIVAAIGRGEMVIMVDDADRENEGDLILAAEDATPDNVGFMLRYTSGIICLPVIGERLDELELPMMVARNTDVRNPVRTSTVMTRPSRTTRPMASAQLISLAMEKVTKAFRPSPVARAKG